MEVCSLRDAANPFEELNVQVFGISYDDVRSQAAFVEAQKLNFALLSDPDGSVATKYGADRGGRPFAKRYTFVIDDAGVLRHRFEKVDVRAHGTEVADKVRELQADK